MRTVLLSVALCLTLGVFAQHRLPIYFKTGSTVINDSALIQLKAFANEHNQCGHSTFVQGHSDGVGNAEKNLQLSLLRAQAVTLALQNFRKDSLEAVAFGERDALAAGDTLSNQQYRRVDVICRTSVCCGTKDGNDIADLYRLLQDEGQTFCINPDKDTALVGANGTIVYYKPGTFINTNGCACLRLVLHEYYKKSDLILHNLTTTSNGEPLESGGMIKLEGFCGGDTLRYNDGKFLTVMVPSDTLLPGMKLLSANRRDAGEILNWQLDKEYPDLDGFDAARMMMFCGFRGNITPGKCAFFFCRIRNFFRGTSKLERDLVRLGNQFFAENTLLQKYNMDPDKLGKALEQGNKDALKYYVYRNAAWDYHNIDRYMKGSKFLDYIVEENHKPSTDVKLVYTSTKAVLPSFEKAGWYQFSKVFDNQTVHIVGLKWEAKQAYLSLSKENSSSAKSKLNFSTVSIEELKTVLKRLD